MTDYSQTKVSILKRKLKKLRSRVSDSRWYKILRDLDLPVATEIETLSDRDVMIQALNMLEDVKGSAHTQAMTDREKRRAQYSRERTAKEQAQEAMQQRSNRYKARLRPGW